MRLSLQRCVVEVDGQSLSAAVADSFQRPVKVGPVAVSVDGDGELGFDWVLTNKSGGDVLVRSVALVFRIDEVVGDLRMFRNGYQSWSPTGVATFGVDHDPSTKAHFEFLQGVHAADQREARAGELRSEWVTALDDSSGAGPLVAGFDAGTKHDGTFRLRTPEPPDAVPDAVPDGRPADVPTGVPTGVPEGVVAELWVEAFMGDVVVHPGGRRELHGFGITGGDGSSIDELLAAWADASAARTGARASAPYQLGWCSWYHYFHDVTEDHIRTNLAYAVKNGWPFDVFQLDDGYQSAIGDWLSTNDKFPSGLPAIAEVIADAGYRPGLWLAPFLAAPDSVLATEHPDWLAKHVTGSGEERTMYCWWNPPWGGGDNGFMYGLDTSNPEVLAHIATVARALVGMGFTYLKLDFTFAPSFDGVWHDPCKTPAERVRAGYAAVREGAGPDAFILGCGAPLSNIVGIVDGNRIGQDVAPLWALDPANEIIPGFQRVEPSTQNAFGNTLARAFMHRRFWLNDPDCLMLRTTNTLLSGEAAHTWARAVGLSGGMALVSDDLGLLDGSARTMLDEAVTLGRIADGAAREGTSPIVPDLMASTIPTTIVAADHTLVVDVPTGASTFT